MELGGEITGKVIREYLQKRAREEKPKTKEEVLRFLEMVFHELKVMGKIRREVDIDYWKNYFSKRWEDFLENN